MVRPASSATLRAAVSFGMSPTAIAAATGAIACCFAVRPCAASGAACARGSAGAWATVASASGLPQAEAQAISAAASTNFIDLTPVVLIITDLLHPVDVLAIQR